MNEAVVHDLDGRDAVTADEFASAIFAMQHGDTKIWKKGTHTPFIEYLRRNQLIPDWVENRNTIAGVIVFYDDSLYRCNTTDDGTNGAPDTNSNFTRISGDPGDATPGTPGTAGADGQDAWSSTFNAGSIELAHFNSGSGRRFHWDNNGNTLNFRGLGGDDERLINSLLETSLVQVRRPNGDVYATMTLTSNGVHVQGDHYRLLGNFDIQNPFFSTGTNFHFYFTQARPGEDGTNGTNGINGQNAEIEIEDTTDGIRVRGKSGGQDNFGDWHNVNDGEDGDDADDGTGFELIYAVQDAQTVTAANRPSNSWGYNEPATAGALTWYSEPQAVSSSTRYQFISVREITGTPSDGDAVSDNWSTPVLWSNYARDGMDGTSGGLADPDNTRQESIKFNALTTNVVYNANADPLTAIATDPIVVEYGDGDPVIITATEAISGGGTAITIAKAGVYFVDFMGIVNQSNSDGRVVPGIDIYRSDVTADYTDNDDKLASMAGHYGRNQTNPTNKRFSASGKLTIPEDNTQIKVIPVSLENHGSANVPYTMQANSILSITRFGADALSQEEIENFITANVHHVIFRRYIAGAGVLQAADMRFENNVIHLRDHNDTVSGWFGDLPTTTRIKLRGQTSGAYRIGTLTASTETDSGITLTLNVTDTHGIFTNHETVILTFDQAHEVQTDWDQTDTNKPDFLKNKPTIPAAQVNADWDETDNTDPSFIENKPTIPTVTPQVQSDWDETDNTNPAFIQNKPSTVGGNGGGTPLQRTFWWGHGQNERDSPLRELSEPWVIRWDTTKRYQRGDAIDVTFESIGGVVQSDPSNTETNTGFTIPAGTYDLHLWASGSQNQLHAPLIRLQKVQSGRDDVILTEVEGFTNSREEMVEPTTTYYFFYPELEVDGTEHFYFECFFNGLTSSTTETNHWAAAFSLTKLA